MISNLEYYRVFFAVASFRHFTRAAEYLCVSQSAVSQSIRKLETELGCRLFERSGKGLVLTAEGEELFTHIKKAMQEIHTGENSISKLAAMKTGELQIGATETSLRFYILEQIRAFKEEHPQIRITFHGTTMQDLCHQLQNEEIEVGFEEGDMVVVTGGAWKDTTGVVSAINKQKQTVTINVELFGRETPVEISFKEIRKM